MAHSKTPEELLDKQMNRIGLGKVVSMYFFKKGEMSQNDVLTLREFMMLNSSIVVRYERMVTWKNEDTKLILTEHMFSTEKAAWAKIRTFLLKHHFTSDDWMQLLPTITRNNREEFDFAQAKKEDLLATSVHRTTNLKSGCLPAKKLMEIFHERENTDEKEFLTVQDMLSLTSQEMQKLLLPLNYNNRITAITFEKVQARFKEYGLTAEDGPFMSIPFPDIKTPDDVIMNLVTEKGFSQDEASLLVTLTNRAGWPLAG